MDIEIPKEWLEFCEFKPVSPEYPFYVWCQNIPNVETISISEIEPPRRDIRIDPFKKFKMVPVLMALMNPNGELPPVVVTRLPLGGMYKYKLKDGFHRFYASTLVGYKLIPAVISA